MNTSFQDWIHLALNKMENQLILETGKTNKPLIKQSVLQEIHSFALMRLVTSFEPLCKSKFPETLVLDFERLCRIQDHFQFVVSSAAMLETVKDAIIETKNKNDLLVRRPILFGELKFKTHAALLQIIPRVLDLFAPRADSKMDVHQAFMTFITRK